MPEPDEDGDKNQNTPPDIDNALLARLNALRTSSVSFNQRGLSSTSAGAGTSGPSSDPQNVSNDLTTRFAALGSRNTSLPSEVRGSGAAATHDARSYLISATADAKASGQTQTEEEQVLDALLSELVGDEDSWAVQPDESREIEMLLAEGRTALAESEKLRSTEDAKGADGETEEGEHDEHSDGKESEGETKQSLQAQADEEAANAVARILAELEYEKNHPDEAPPSYEEVEREGKGKGDTATRHDDDGPSLPTVPGSAPSSSTTGPEEKGPRSDDALAARLAALSLPSTPEGTPGKRTAKKGSTKPKTSKRDDGEEWCVICSEDGTVTCLGCDGDVYCDRCWNESHRGPGATFDQSGHRARRFLRSGGETAAAA